MGLAAFLACLACMASLVSGTGTEAFLEHGLPPAYPPHHHHHRHHHYGPGLSPVLPPIYPPPDKPPTHPPVKPPTYPPLKPPSHPPVKPPTHPPIKPPTYPPLKPPSHPPVKPPSHPPVKPPTYPPLKPPSHPPVKPPTHPPVKPPTYPPIKPPAYPPIKPPTLPPSYPPVKPPTPTLPPRSFVAVQGVVYCKSCKYVGIPTLLGASPLSGAVVELKCKSSKIKEVLLTTTDKHGYFFVMAPKTVTSYGAHKCRISLVSSRLKKCKKATNLNFGAVGSPLFNPVPLTIGKLPYLIYSVGPFAFEAEKKCYPY